MIKWTHLFGERGQESASNPTAEPAMLCYLRDVSGITRQKVHPLTTALLIVGRKAEEETPPEASYLLIRQVVVGRRHATIERRPDGFWLSDCHSVNGTYLNGQRVVEPVRLQGGDLVRFYEYEFEFVEESAAIREAALQLAQEAQGKAQRRAAERSGDEDDVTLLYQ